MKKISSNIFFVKKVFPVIWFFGLILFFFVSLTADSYPINTIFLIPLIIVALGGYFIMKIYIWGLVDEVFDCDNYLLIKNNDLQEKVWLSNISDISIDSFFKKSPHATIKLLEPCLFGYEITFSPLLPFFRFNRFDKIAIVEDLILRIDAARLNRKI